LTDITPPDVQLALLRHFGTVRASSQPLGEMERAAEAAGRQVHAGKDSDGGGLLVLGWRGHEPGRGSQPRITRRQFTAGQVKVLVVCLALLADRGPARVALPPAEIAATLERLTGRSAAGIIGPAADTLTRAGLLRWSGGDLVLGPAARVWDAQTRDTIAAAVRKLREYPGWRDGVA
jgi:hypothetical protein